MQILQETDYKKFKYINGNRDVSKKKVKKIVDSYKSGIDLFPYCPILINYDFYVVDGQHRIAACKELGIPVNYVIAPNLTLQQIAQINSNTDKWKNSDFLNCYIKNKIDSYKTLDLFRSKHGVALSVAINLLMSGRTKDGSGGKNMEYFRDGKFEVKYHERAETVMQKCYGYLNVNPNFWNDTRFIVAIEKLMPSKLYNHEEVIEKLKKNGSKIEKKSNYKEYIYHIEELFNKGNSIRKILYTK